MGHPAYGSTFQGSLRSRIKAYFSANPDEWLTITDAAVKWGVREPSVRQTMTQMRRRGELGPGPDLRLPTNTHSGAY